MRYYLEHTDEEVMRILERFPHHDPEAIRESIDLREPTASNDLHQYIDATSTYTHLSPYITHGIITTPALIHYLIERHGFATAQPLIQRLIRKEHNLHILQTWPHSLLYASRQQDTTIETNKQPMLPTSVITGTTGTGRIDELLYLLYHHWRLHATQRKRLASRLVHQADLHWKKCAQRTYYHFLDGDLATNHFERQRIAGVRQEPPYHMHAHELPQYRPGRYDHATIFTDATDSSELLVTPDRDQRYYESLQQREKRRNALDPDNTTVRLLTPRTLQPTLLADDIPTIVIVDMAFNQLHPRSKARCAFIQRQCAAYQIPCILTEYETRLRQLLVNNYHVIIDQRPEPIYRNAQIAYSYHPRITHIPQPLTWPLHPEGEPPIYAFTTYREILLQTAFGEYVEL